MPYLCRSQNPSVHHFYITTQRKYHGGRSDQAATGGRREMREDNILIVGILFVNDQISMQSLANNAAILDA